MHEAKHTKNIKTIRPLARMESLRISYAAEQMIRGLIKE